MSKKSCLGALLALAFSASALAGVELNKADQAALEGVKGIGPALSAKLLEERKKGSFKSWNDMIDRVPGIGAGNAARLSGAGLTVNEAPYAGAAASPTAAPAKAAAAPAAKPVKAESTK